jgi:hypothetical protein
LKVCGAVVASHSCTLVGRVTRLQYLDSPLFDKTLLISERKFGNFGFILSLKLSKQNNLILRNAVYKMLILKIGRILNILLLAVLLCLLLWFFVESFVNNTPETYVLLFYPACLEILILVSGVALLIANIKHRKKTYPDIVTFFFLIPALVFIGILLGKIGTILAMCVILGSIIIQTSKIISYK